MFKSIKVFTNETIKIVAWNMHFKDLSMIYQICANIDELAVKFFSAQLLIAYAL